MNVLLNKYRRHLLAKMGTAILVFAPLTGFSAEVDDLVKDYQEPKKSELRNAINYAQSQFSGKILVAKPEAESGDKSYKIKMLLNNGRIKTFYINKQINRVSE